MRRWYEKNPLTFVLTWIGVYVVGFSVADSLSQSVGMEKAITAPLCVIMTAFLLLWLKKEGLWKTFGLCKAEKPAKTYLYYLPLPVLVSVNLWGGVQLNMSVAETVLYMLTMVGVGILEEIIFRGFLFKAMCKDSVKWAIVVSSITFGLGHVVNLLNGADVLPTLLQIVYAAAAGFLFTMLFYRSGSLLCCIATHSAINTLSAVAGDRGPVLDWIAPVVLTVVAAGYALWILKSEKT